MGEYLPLDYVCDDGDLSIEGVPMRCAAWAVLDLTGLWLPAAQRGQHRVIPGAQGVITNPKRKTITRRSLVLAVTGGFDQFGQSWPSPWVGLRENLVYLRDNVFDPGVADTRTATLTLPDATTETAEVQCYDLEPVRKVDAVHVYTFELELPAGEFV